MEDYAVESGVLPHTGGRALLRDAETVGRRESCACEGMQVAVRVGRVKVRETGCLRYAFLADDRQIPTARSFRSRRFLLGLQGVPHVVTRIRGDKGARSQHQMEPPSPTQLQETCGP